MIACALSNKSLPTDEPLFLNAYVTEGGVFRKHIAGLWIAAQ